MLVRGPEPGPPLLAYIDLTRGVKIDRSWYRASGMRASESHRVVFHGARVDADGCSRMLDGLAKRATTAMNGHCRHA